MKYLDEDLDYVSINTYLKHAFESLEIIVKLNWLSLGSVLTYRKALLDENESILWRLKLFIDQWILFH